MLADPLLCRIGRVLHSEAWFETWRMRFYRFLLAVAAATPSNSRVTSLCSLMTAPLGSSSFRRLAAGDRASVLLDSRVSSRRAPSGWLVTWAHERGT